MEKVYKNVSQVAEESAMSGWIDRRRWRWWDRVKVTQQDDARSDIEFFRVPIGQLDPWSGQRKTKLDTNMLQPSQFPPPYCHVSSQIGFKVADPIADAFYAKCWAELKILGKIFVEGPLWRFQDGEGFINPKTGDDIPLEPIEQIAEERKHIIFQDQQWAGGFPVPQAGFRFTPIFIPPLCHLTLRLFFPAGIPDEAIGLYVTAYIDGVTDIPVQ